MDSSEPQFLPFASQPRARSVLAVAIMLILTEAVYLRPSLLTGTERLNGFDFEQLHIKRISFARDAFLGPRHAIPAWYPREFMGTPFAANLQSFPWIPTRLVLFLFDPDATYAPGVAIAAALSALFTFLYCRRVGLSRLGAVAAGWTFACAGYFSSRVMAGHLPLLEAYPALPLLLWLTDRAIAPERAGRQALDLGLLALAGACVVVAGHPQIPAYSFAATFLYTLWRARGWLFARIVAALALGIGSTFAVLYPMLLLIGRSTRVLHLQTPDNDIFMPYWRLLSLISPGIDGWPQPLPGSSGNPFRGYPNTAWFWDTVCYVGILPLLAIAGLFIACVLRKRLPAWRWAFLAVLGSGAFLLALPLAQPLYHMLPGTILRSPCRIFYLWTFCAAAALGAAVDAFRRTQLPGGAPVTFAVLAVCLGMHGLDLWRLDRLFTMTRPSRYTAAPAERDPIEKLVGDGRIAVDSLLFFPFALRLDDVGGFDSIWLARFQLGMRALQMASTDMNDEVLDGTLLPLEVLQAASVRLVAGRLFRADLQLMGRASGVFFYLVPDPRQRADFVAADRAEFSSEEQIPFLITGRRDRLLLPSGDRRYLPVDGRSNPHSGATSPSALQYSRIDSDEIGLQVSAAQPGFVRVVETFDPGWSATVDGAPAPLLPANVFEMAVPVSSGSHTIALRYRTPGRFTGAVLSLLDLCLLAGLLGSAHRPDAAGADCNLSERLL